jgi:uncharacterized membrane protein
MNKVIFVAFDAEQKAFEGDRALHEMHRDGLITLYDDAVVVKDANGKVVVREEPETSPLATLGGMVTGGLIGLLGGPVGAAVGMSTGTLVGAAFDLTRDGVAQEFVEDAGARLEPGKVAVIAEIDEDWQVPLDTRMEALGGKLIRHTKLQIDDLYMERDVEITQRELANLEAEKLASVKAAQTAKAGKEADKLQAKIDATKRKLQDKENALTAQAQSVKEEGQDKISALEAQKATATVEARTQLEQREAEIRADYDKRIKRLQDALNRRKAAHA